MTMSKLESRWINVVAGVVGGVILGSGIGWLARYGTPGAVAWTVLGGIILWWAFSDRRKRLPDTPESEVDGRHTIE
jgi:hypothetical protein